MRRILLFIAFITQVFCSFSQGDKLFTAIQQSHLGAIYALQYSADGRFLVTGSSDHTLKLWEVNTGKVIRTFYGHKKRITSISISFDGSKMISGSTDNSAIVWDVQTGELLSKIEMKDRITSVALNKAGTKALIGGYEWQVLMYDILQKQIVRNLKSNPDKGSGAGVNLAFSEDESLVLISGDDKRMTIYSVSDTAYHKEFRSEKEGWCGGCGTQFSSFGNKIILTSRRSGVKEFTFSGKETNSFDIEEEQTQLVSSSKYVVFSSESVITVLDRKSFKQIRKIPIADEGCFSLALHPTQNTLAVGLKNHKIIFFNLESGKQTATFSGLNETTEINYDITSMWEYYIANALEKKNNLALSPSQKYILKGKVDSSFVAINLETGRIDKVFRGHKKTVLDFNFINEGKQILSADESGEVILWDFETQKEIKRLKAHRDPILDLGINNAETEFFTASWDASVKIWDAKTFELKNTIRLEKGAPYTAQFVQHDLYLLISNLKDNVFLFEKNTGKLIKEYIGHTDVCQQLVFNSEAKEFVSASWDGMLKKWSITSELQEFSIQTPNVLQALAMSPSTKLMAFSGEDRDVYLLTNEKITDTLKGHAAPVTSLVFRGNNYLISYSADGEMILWDLVNKKQVYSHYSLGAKDWLVRTPSGHFDATQEIRKYLYYIKGNESFSIDRFFDRFYTPGLIQKALKNNSVGDGSVIQDLKLFPPPHIEIETELETKNGQKEINLKLAITDQGGGIDEIKVTLNGKRIPLEDQRGLERSPEKGNKLFKFMSIMSVPGVNHLEVSAFSKARVESKVSVKDVMNESVELVEDCHVLVIGINKYANSNLNLNFAVADAESFSKAIKSQGKKLFRKVYVHELTDTEATKENILKKLDEIAAMCQPQDVFLFYYAGHGVMVENDFYFVPTEVTRLYDDEVKQKALYVQDVQEKALKIKALKQVMIIDACHSGGAVSALAQRGAGTEKAIAQLSRSTGIHVLASTNSEQTAKEFIKLEHGVFSYVLLEGLAGKADGSPLDGNISIYELKSYLDTHVPALTQELKGSSQYPYTFSIGNDFPISTD